MRTAQLAAAAGVSPPTLRYYERRGLLPAPQRSATGYRCYGPDAVRIVRFVKRAQQLGFTLTEIESLLELAAGGPQSCSEAHEMATGAITELNNKIAHLAAMRTALQRLADACAQPGPERDCPLLSALDDDTEETDHDDRQ